MNLNPAALLSLIGTLWAQLAEAQERIAELERRLGDEEPE